MSHPLDAIQVIDTPLGPKKICRLDVLGDLSHLPYSIKILLESCLRNLDNYIVTQAHVDALKNYQATSVGEQEIAFKPGRVVLQDFTGVPAVVDLAAMRAAVVRMTGREDSADKVNPLVPCDLVIDHSVQVDAFASANAESINCQARVRAQQRALSVSQVGPASVRQLPRRATRHCAIVHQVNLEYLAKVVWDTDDVLHPDSLVGTDSHTTMINGLGVLGWGVGGIEAEAGHARPAHLYAHSRSRRRQAYRHPR